MTRMQRRIPLSKSNFFSRLFGSAGRRHESTDLPPGSDDTPHGGQGGGDVLEAFNVTKNKIIARRVEWSGSSDTRRKGLLGRDQIDNDEGMYIVPTQWIHMFGMRFAIDVAFLAGDGRVLHIHHRLKPNRLSRIVWRAEGALELAAGTIEATGTAIGDFIELR